MDVIFTVRQTFWRHLTKKKLWLVCVDLEGARDVNYEY